MKFNRIFLALVCSISLFAVACSDGDSTSSNTPNPNNNGGDEVDDDNGDSGDEVGNDNNEGEVGNDNGNEQADNDDEKTDDPNLQGIADMQWELYRSDCLNALTPIVPITFSDGSTGRCVFGPTDLDGDGLSETQALRNS